MSRVKVAHITTVEMAFRIPAKFKIRGWSMKRIFKQAVCQLVPSWVLNKPKHGFAVPIDPWFRGKLKNFAFEVLLDPHTTHRGYFNTNVVERMWREHVNGRHVWNNHLWLLLNFELWHRVFIDVDKPQKNSAVGKYNVTK